MAACPLAQNRDDDPARSDDLSDYDVILVVAYAQAFRHDDGWQSGFGTPLVRWGDDADVFGVVTYFQGVVSESSLEIRTFGTEVNRGTITGAWEKSADGSEWKTTST
jgi:hypothetical protein